MIAAREDLTEQVMEHVDFLFAQRRRSFCAQPLSREVSLPQLHLLMALQESGRMTVSELATHMQVSTPSASSILDRLEEHALVDRVRDEEDRRVVHVAISARGRMVVEELTGMKREYMQRLLGVMTDKEIGDVLRGAQAVGHALARINT